MAHALRSRVREHDPRSRMKKYLQKSIAIPWTNLYTKGALHQRHNQKSIHDSLVTVNLTGRLSRSGHDNRDEKDAQDKGGNHHSHADYTSHG